MRLHVGATPICCGTKPPPGRPSFNHRRNPSRVESREARGITARTRRRLLQSHDEFPDTPYSKNTGEGLRVSSACVHVTSLASPNRRRPLIRGSVPFFPKLGTHFSRSRVKSATQSSARTVLKHCGIRCMRNPEKLAHDLFKECAS